MWTQFWDMHSGGGQKEKWANIYIEAPGEEAEVIFYNRFGHNPRRITCTCCGPDYVIESDEDLAQLTAYHRGCAFVEGENGGGHYIEEPDSLAWHPYISLEDYMKLEGDDRESRTFIYAKDIKPEERIGQVPEQGYIWKD